MSIVKKSLNAVYKPTEKTIWKGRKSNSNIENQYWHQEIQLVNLQKKESISNIDIALLGYVCDEGVRRNKGRVGAKKGPEAIRKQLTKLPIHFEKKQIADIGDVVCIDNELEACQLLFSNHISNLINQNIFPIAIGGGHDMAYGHFMGIWDVVKTTEKKHIGIINFDAHFDLRPVEEKPNSGTPFNQILSELKKTSDKVNYFAIGIQQQSNTKELFHIAKKNHVNYAINDDCKSSTSELETLKNRLIPFIKKVDYLYITIDLDGFSSAYSSGVSAPSPLGFTPHFVFKMLSFLFESKKVISLDIAELNPSFDKDYLTANLAAKIIDFVVNDCL